MTCSEVTHCFDTSHPFAIFIYDSVVVLFDIKGGREEGVIDTDYCNVNIIVLVYESQPTLFLARSIFIPYEFE